VRALVRPRAIAATVVRVTREFEPVAVVTGGSYGVGREIACDLAGRGIAVVVVYLGDQVAAEATVEEILGAGGTALALRADVTDALDVERLFRETKAVFGVVDIVVHATVGEAAVLDEHAARELAAGGVFADVGE
jgi:NAD(P)-dependent dehydrogenase (short-subunit alcohol dehydrogenase family)